MKKSPVEAQNHPTADLAAYRELSPAERQAVQAHLAVCEACRAQLETFQRQDALLSALPELSPRRQSERWPAPARPGHVLWVGLARLGDMMAVGGLATITVAAVLILRAMAVAPASTGSAPLAPGLPFSLPPDLPALVNPWVLAAPWLGGALALVGLLLALGQRSWVWPLLGVGLSGVLLLGFVPPLSALPNPIGLFWRVANGYSYDPNLPFRNMFVMSGKPEDKLRFYMDDLMGQVGLDPLDPLQPLAHYRFERVSLWQDHRMALVRTRFVYADGSSRVYEIPLSDPYAGPFNFQLWGWQSDGLGRLRTQHLALPGQPFADEDSPPRLGQPVRLALSPEVEQLDQLNPAHWLWISNRLQRLVPSPGEASPGEASPGEASPGEASPLGDAFLMCVEREDGTRQLWWVPLDGGSPQLISRARSVYEYGWSPDGTFVVYTAPDEMQTSARARNEVVRLLVVRPEAPDQPLAQRVLSNASLPSLTGQGIWYVQEGALWLMAYTGGEAIRVAALPGLGYATNSQPTFWPVAVSPDSSQVAYACGLDVCVMTLSGTEPHIVPADGARALSWSPDGQRLAAVSLDHNNFGPVRLLLISRQGKLLHQVDIAPRDASDPPQWTPDGEYILVQTYPMGGRRMISVNAGTVQVLDLSQEHWDAYFTLSADGEHVLLNNGRGGFWLAPLLR